MNNGSRIRLFLIVVIVLGGIIGGSIIYILLQSGTQEVQLTIYTYDSLFWDPYYDLEGNFSEFSGIPKKQINIIRLDDANAIVARLLIEKDQPQADVAIGIDNALIHLIENKSDIFELYTPENISQIDTNLIQNLDPDKYLTPYDYGIISLYYQNNVINSSTNPDIAVYGDPEINIDGLLTDNWRDWWRTAKNSDMTITKSWGDAFDIFFEPSEGKPIMVSYGTSPAYGYCQWEDDSTSAVVTYENDTANAWFQIEGIGLVKNAPHKDNAKLFIDWFLGKELQSNLPEHQWMYPANTQAILSECFIQSAISPDEVNRLNDLISPALLSEHMSQWQDEWELIMVLEA